MIRKTPLIAAALAAALTNSTAHASPFWNSYYAARGGYGGGDDITDMLANQRNAEAIANAYRQAHGLPRCSIGLLGQWRGMPAC